MLLALLFLLLGILFHLFLPSFWRNDLRVLAQVVPTHFLRFDVRFDRVVVSVTVQIWLLPAIGGGPFLLNIPLPGKVITIDMMPRDCRSTPVLPGVVQCTWLLALEERPRSVELDVCVSKGLRQHQVAAAFCACVLFPFGLVNFVVGFGVSSYSAL